ncbi:MAG TPA: dihydropyrimidinase [Elusimicrobiota bacterium]|nr:dihydropyrimidinase [Elusimicrobiota bacterium]
MRYSTLIQGGTVYTSTETAKADIALSGEKIVAIAPHLPSENTRVIDARGLLVIPGGIDVHVHCEIPFCGTVSADGFESATRAAARGGVTTLIDFANQGGLPRLMDGVEARIRQAEDKVCVDYSLHSSVSNYKKLKDPAREFRRLTDFGIPTHKMYMIYEKEGWQSDDADIFAGLSETREMGGTIMVHAESERVMNLLIDRYRREKKRWGAYAHVLSRPNFIEEEAVQRVIKWAEATRGHLYIVHLSTGGGADLIHQAQHRGINVHAETCPHYLLLTDDVFKDRKRGHWYATCPQIKKKADQVRLWKGLERGDISVVSTDTCTFTTRQKDRWNGDFTKIPYGLPGVETMIPAVYTFGVKKGRFSVNHMVSLVATNPAKMMGLYPRKGTIAVGSDADLALIDPSHVRTIDFKDMSTHCDWSPYQGLRMGGFPKYTFSRGRMVVDQGRFIGRRGWGRFIPREPWGWKKLNDGKGPRLFSSGR